MAGFNRVAFLLLLTVAIPSLGLAHVDGGPMGTPKSYCENLAGDTNVHEYGPIGFSNHDSQGYRSVGTFGGGVHILGDLSDPSMIYLWTIGYGSDGNMQDCDGDGIAGDYDDHYDFAVGGGWLLACDGGEYVNRFPEVCGGVGFIEGAGLGPGTTNCWGTHLDHAAFPSVEVTDAVLTSLSIPVGFYIASDYLNNLPPLDPRYYPEYPNCGDFETDYWMACVDQCLVTFPPGLDGSYAVYVDFYGGAVLGHIDAT